MNFERVSKIILTANHVDDLPLGSHFPDDARPMKLFGDSRVFCGIKIDIMIPEKSFGTKRLHWAKPGTNFKGRTIERKFVLPFPEGEIEFLQLGGNEDVNYAHLHTAVIRDDCHI